LIRECSFVLYDSTPCKGKERGETPLFLSYSKKKKIVKRKKK